MYTKLFDKLQWISLKLNEPLLDSSVPLHLNPLKLRLFALKYTHEPHLVLTFFFGPSHYDGMSHTFKPHVDKNVGDASEDKPSMDNLEMIFLLATNTKLHANMYWRTKFHT